MSENIQEQVERSIASISDQIEWLSKRCKMLDVNQKDEKHAEWTLEASALMLQLSRSLNELITTRRLLTDEGDNPYKVIDNVLGRRS